MDSVNAAETHETVHWASGMRYQPTWSVGIAAVSAVGSEAAAPEPPRG